MTGAKILKQGEKYLGDSGRVFCREYYGKDHIVAWCCIWVWYVFRKAGASKLFYGGGKVCNVANADSWLRRNCEWVKIKDAKPGDIVIFTWSGHGNNSRVGSRDHIGIVVKPMSGDKLRTIEGNVGSSSPSKSIVAYRTRTKGQIYAIYHPDYKDSPSPAPKDITQLVKDTLEGKYGSGAARVKALGDDYADVQNEVNRIVFLTNDVLMGKYGNGAERKKNLGADYDLVQWNINRIYKNK